MENEKTPITKSANTNENKLSVEGKISSTGIVLNRENTAVSDKKPKNLRIIDKAHPSEVFTISSNSVAPDIDPKQLEKLCNPAYYAFLNALKDMEKSPSNDTLEAIHDILLIDNSQNNIRIQEKLTDLYKYIRYPDLYERLCLILCDISHLNKPVVKSLLDFEIFEFLDYKYAITYNLVISICDGNIDAWSTYKKYISNPKIDISRLKLLSSQYKE